MAPVMPRGKGETDLADEAIPAKLLAGPRHDHVLVPEANPQQAEDALHALRADPTHR